MTFNYLILAWPDASLERVTLDNLEHFDVSPIIKCAPYDGGDSTISVSKVFFLFWNNRLLIRGQLKIEKWRLKFAFGQLLKQKGERKKGINQEIRFLINKICNHWEVMEGKRIQRFYISSKLIALKIRFLWTLRVFKKTVISHFWFYHMNRLFTEKT